MDRKRLLLLAPDERECQDYASQLPEFFRLLDVECHPIDSVRFDEPLADLMLVDLRIPAVAASRLLHSSKCRQPETPVIGLHAGARRELALAIGCDDYLIEGVGDRRFGSLLEVWLSYPPAERQNGSASSV